MSTQFSDNDEGVELLEIANDCWNDNRHEYRGIYFTLSVQQTKQQLDKPGKGKQARKDFKAEAVKITTALFNEARDSDSHRLSAVAGSIASSGDVLAALGDSSPLTEFAQAVCARLQQAEKLEMGAFGKVATPVFGIIDPTMIIGLITAIITAIRNCKKPVTPPSPPAPPSPPSV